MLRFYDSSPTCAKNHFRKVIFPNRLNAQQHRDRSVSLICFFLQKTMFVSGNNISAAILRTSMFPNVRTNYIIAKVNALINLYTADLTLM